MSIPVVAVPPECPGQTAHLVRQVAVPRCIFAQSHRFAVDQPPETVSFFVSCERSTASGAYSASCRQVRSWRSGSQLESSCGLMLPVFIQKTVEQASLGRPTHPLGRCKIKNGRSFGSHHHALVAAGMYHSTSSRAANRSSFLIQHTTNPGRFSFSLPKP